MVVDLRLEWTRDKESGEICRQISIPTDEKKRKRLAELLWKTLERASGCKVVLVEKNENPVYLGKVVVSTENSPIEHVEPEKRKRGRPKTK